MTILLTAIHSITSSLLHFVLLAQQALSDVLDGVLGLVLGELFEGLDQRRHYVLVQVLANGQVGVDGVLLALVLTLIIRLSISRVYRHHTSISYAHVLEILKSKRIENWVAAFFMPIIDASKQSAFCNVTYLPF